MFSRCTALFLLFAFTSIHADLFDQRSGDIIFDHTADLAAQTSWSVGDVEVQDVQVYNMLARVSGAPRVQINDVPGAPIADIWGAQKRVLIVSVEGLSHMGLPANLQVLGKTRATSVASTSSLATPFSVLASALSGSNLANHGVVNKGWPSLDLDDKSDDFYATGNLFDRLLTTTHGNGAVSVSGAWSLVGAKLVSPHRRSVTQTKKNGLSFHWNSKAARFVPVISGMGRSELEIGKDNFLDLASRLGKTLNKGQSLVYTPTEASLKVSLQNQHSVTFDISSEADMAFLSELLFLFNAGLVAEAPSKTLSFHFESLKMLGDKYGLQSPQFQTAVILLDHVLHLLTSSKTAPRFNEFVVFFFPTSSAPTAGQKETAELAVSTVLKTVINMGLLHQHFPHVYVQPHTSTASAPSSARTSMDKVSSVCLHVRSALSPEQQAKVFCRGEPQFTLKRAEMQSPTPTPSPSPSPPGPDSTAVGQFQVIVWASVLVVIVMTCAVYCLFSISDYASKDVVLYGSTRMVFERASRPQRKGRNH